MLFSIYNSTYIIPLTEWNTTMSELFSKRELLEGQESVTLHRYREMLLDKMSDLEIEIHLVNDVLENGYGVTVAMGGIAISKASESAVS